MGIYLTDYRTDPKDEVTSFKQELPAIEFPRKSSTAWAAIAFEEISEAIDFVELGVEAMTPTQKKVWERYKQKTVQFAHDMMLAEGDIKEIRNRLGVKL